MPDSPPGRRLLVVTEAGDVWPSGRIRALIYRDRFERDGIDAVYVTRGVPPLVRLLEQPNRFMTPLMGAGLGRLLGDLNNGLARRRERGIVDLVRGGRDVVYLQKAASLSLVRALRASTRARLVYDLNDAVWLPSRSSFAGGQVRDILRHVDAVTCDNPEGLAFARAYNAAGFLVPDPAQVELFDRRRGDHGGRSAEIRIGWIGSPATLFNLYAIWQPLEQLFAKFDRLALRLVGTGHDRRLLPPFERVRFTTRPFYTQDEMIDEILQMDIGLFPLFDVEDSRARGILKAALYMSGAACVVASPVGQVRDIVADGVNGLLAPDAGAWFTQLCRVVEDADQRRRLGQAGLETVRERFSLDRCYETLCHALFGPGASVS